MAAQMAQAFAALVGAQVEDEQIDLPRAALTIAQTEYPRLQFEPWLARLDALAARVAARVHDPGDAPQVVASLNRVLFEEEGFRGNLADYSDPRNSFLNDVLDRKLGIPITLSLVYMEVARRVGFPLFGVGMPGHFLLKYYDAEGRAVLIDAFEGGKLLAPEDCQRRLDEIYAGGMLLQPQFLVAVTRRQLLVRMLGNLRSIYLSTRNLRKALEMVDLVLAIYPRSAEDVKQRAVLRYNLTQMRGAVADFEDYLKMATEASDAADIRQIALSIRRMLATLN